MSDLKFRPCYVYVSQGLFLRDPDISKIKSHPLTHSLSVNLHRSLSRLRAIAMTRKEVIFECRQVQRQWMELRALIDYIEIYEPHMDSCISVFCRHPLLVYTSPVSLLNREYLDYHKHHSTKRRFGIGRLPNAFSHWA